MDHERHQNPDVRDFGGVAVAAKHLPRTCFGGDRSSFGNQIVFGPKIIVLCGIGQLGAPSMDPKHLRCAAWTSH
jgi:hypothetical protein